MRCASILPAGHWICHFSQLNTRQAYAYSQLDTGHVHIPRWILDTSIFPGGYRTCPYSQVDTGHVHIPRWIPDMSIFPGGYRTCPYSQVDTGHVHIPRWIPDMSIFPAGHSLCPYSHIDSTSSYTLAHRNMDAIKTVYTHRYCTMYICTYIFRYRCTGASTNQKHII